MDGPMNSALLLWPVPNKITAGVCDYLGVVHSLRFGAIINHNNNNINNGYF